MIDVGELGETCHNEFINKLNGTGSIIEESYNQVFIVQPW